MATFTRSAAVPLNFGEQNAARIVTAVEVRAHLERQFMLAETGYQTGGPARYVTVRETGDRFGFIMPLTHNFFEAAIVCA